RLLMDQVERFIEVYPQSPLRAEANERYARYAGIWDEHDFREAAAFSQAVPENFAARIARYQEYIDRHGASGRFVDESRKAIEQIRFEWSEHDYRSIYEYFVRYPNDARAVASRLRRYVEGHPDSRHRSAAEQYLARFE